MAASAVLPSGATAQRAAGEIGVSLTIVPPSVLQSVRLADVPVDQGRASMRTAPTTRRTPAVVTRLSADGRRAASTRRELVQSCAEGRTGCPAHEIEHRVDAGGSLPDDIVRVVRLRREYVVVPGT